jgi:hypothetical protein
MAHDRSIEARLRRKLAYHRHEATPVARMGDAERELRARLQDEFPAEDPEWIEARLARIMARLCKPTTAAAPPRTGIPLSVLAARKAARKGQVRRGRGRRRA